MKFGYADVENIYLIQKYQVKDNFLIITYLDGHKETEDYSIERERQILEIMLSQARRRDAYYKENSLTTEKDYQRLKKQSDWEWLAGLIAFIYHPVCQIIGLTGLCSSVIHNLIATQKILTYKKELDKYQIFLDTQSDWEILAAKNIPDPELPADFNINTLDQKSSKEVKEKALHYHQEYFARVIPPIATEITNGSLTGIITNYQCNEENPDDSQVIILCGEDFITVKVDELIENWQPTEAELTLKRTKEDEKK